MGKRLGDREADRALQGVLAIQAMGCGRAKARPVPFREDGGIGLMRLQKNSPFVIAHDIGEEFVVVAQVGKVLRHTFLLTSDDLDSGQRQQALRRFL